MTDVLKIRSHAELVATIPHMLGFRPQGMVCLAFGDGPTARLDIPESPGEMAEFVQTLAEVYLYIHHPRRVALVAYGEGGAVCMEALAALGDALINGEVRGPDVGPILWVNGEEWTDVLEGSSGTVDPSTRGRIDAEFALMGRVMPIGQREDLAAAMKGDPNTVAEHLTTAQARARGLDAASRRSEIGWFGARLEAFGRDREYLSDGDAARVLALLPDSGIRDAAVVSMSRAAAPVFSELWLDLVRRAPTEVRDNPATLLALSSFLEGKGAQAWTALEQLSQSNPLAELLAQALEQAMDPREWDRPIPAAASTLMQQATLRDNSRARHTEYRNAHTDRGIDGAGPQSSAPGR